MKHYVKGKLMWRLGLVSVARIFKLKQKDKRNSNATIRLAENNFAELNEKLLFISLKAQILQDNVMITRHMITFLNYTSGAKLIIEM